MVGRDRLEALEEKPRLFHLGRLFWISYSPLFQIINQGTGRGRVLGATASANQRKALGTMKAAPTSAGARQASTLHHLFIDFPLLVCTARLPRIQWTRASSWQAHLCSVAMSCTADPGAMAATSTPSTAISLGEGGRGPSINDWSRQRPVIKRLYIDERRKLKEVMETMATEYNFVAS